MRNTQLLLLAGALAGLTAVGTAAAAGNFNGNRCNAPYYEAGAGMFIDPVTGIGVGECIN